MKRFKFLVLAILVGSMTHCNVPAKRTAEEKKAPEEQPPTQVAPPTETIPPDQTAPPVQTYPPATGAPAANTLTVTNTQDYLPWDPPIKGSFRAVTAAAPAGSMITFSVGGNIPLAAQLVVSPKGLFIDGASAPTPGITFTKDQITIAGSGIRLKQLRFRSGDGYANEAARMERHGQYNDYTDVPGHPDQANTGGIRSLVISGEDPANPTVNVSIENCSIENSTDDNGSVWNYCDNILFTRCLFAGGYAKVHIKDAINDNSKGAVCGTDSGRPKISSKQYVVFDQCVFTSCASRVPDLYGGVCSVVNCMIISPYQGGVLTNSTGNIMNNLAYSMPNHPWGTAADRPLTGDSTVLPNDALFASGNYLDGKLVGSSVIGEKNQAQKDLKPSVFRRSKYASTITLIDPVTLIKNLLNNAGCTVPVRDSIDTGYIESARARVDASPMQ